MACSSAPVARCPAGAALRRQLLSLVFALLLRASTCIPPFKGLAHYVPAMDPGDCLIARAGGWGLGSQLVHLLHAASLVPQERLYWEYQESPYRCCPEPGTEAGSACNPWRTLFEASAPPADAPLHFRFLNDVTVDFLDNATGDNRTCLRWAALYVARFNRAGYNRSDPRACAALCAPLLALWRLAPDMRVAVDYELATLAHYPPPLLVLQVRGGDKLGTEVQPYDLRPGVERLAARHAAQGGTCVILGDDWALGQRAEALARELLNCSALLNRLQPSYAHYQRRMNAESAASRCWRTQRLLVDIELLAAADGGAALLQSNVARVATLLRECRKPGAAAALLDWQGRDALREACIPF